ncbi:ATP-dependent DNA helicase RecQ [Arthrobacter sp. B0490]|uniref:RecQ family ATP-dependent DNA helicase n=1 Tax=Arthrobacter sp. B0490 TaxID=2058891 RepID=UPI000CE4C506|nr:RecQ family ATP-dependent DNA helicase [Arthrobacter sp. B0490]
MTITLHDLRSTAASTFGWEDLRPGQERAMEAVLAGRSVLCVMPTGSGKSAIYQVPALTLPGVAVVVSPLIALQHDQAESINETSGSVRAYVINSGMRKTELDAAWDAAADDDEATRAKFLFLAPEQIARDDVATRLRSLDVSLVVVDEAHCVASWGHDFRPDYLQLGHLLRDLRVPVVALTATASHPVQTEIAERLHLAGHAVIVEGFDRPNLTLDVVQHVDGAEKERAVRDQVLALEGPGLVYTATKKSANALAAELQERGRRADVYHAGRLKKERQAVHEGFLDGSIDVVVATTAFGMGIDKPDVRFVLHADISDSLDSYYQEIGRGGRDGLGSRAILHYRPEDLSLRRFFAAKSVNRTRLRELFAFLAARGKPVTVRKLKELSGLPPRKLAGLLNLLVASGAVGDGVKGYRARRMSTSDAVEAAVGQAERRERIDRSRVDMARRYAETRGCRRQFLLAYFGEELPGACGNCDNCFRQEQAGTVPESAGAGAASQADVPFEVDTVVEHPEWGRGTVMGYEDGIITVLFGSVGYKTLSTELVEEKELLATVPSGS